MQACGPLMPKLALVREKTSGVEIEIIIIGMEIV
jgi:hypothetical protein